MTQSTKGRDETYVWLLGLLLTAIGDVRRAMESQCYDPGDSRAFDLAGDLLEELEIEIDPGPPVSELPVGVFEKLKQFDPEHFEILKQLRPELTQLHPGLFD